jgi:GH25 family lysozyme M1 (1,4-beta-N-acetylmuramidase)
LATQADFWVAAYGPSEPTLTAGTMVMWQFTQTGHVAGIQGNVDQNKAIEPTKLTCN